MKVIHPMAEPQLRLHFELVARHGNRHPASRGRVGQDLGRASAVDHLLLVVTADLPQAGEWGLDPLVGPCACGNIEDHRGGLTVFVGLPVGVGLESAVGAKLALIQAQAVGHVQDLLGLLDDHFLRLTIGTGLLLLLFFEQRQRTNLQRVPTAGEIRIAQLDPRHFAPEGHLDQVAGEHVRRDRLPFSLVDAPLERRPGAFQADAVPRFVRAALRDRKIVLQQSAVLGPFLDDFLRVPSHFEPFLTGQPCIAGIFIGLHFNVGQRQTITDRLSLVIW